MIGVLITLLFSVGALGVGSALVGRWTQDCDRAERIGLYGLVGLGTIGLITLFIGLLPSGLSWGIIAVGCIAAFGLTVVIKLFKSGELKFAKPDGAPLLFVLVLAVACLFSLVAVLAPSDMLDWDTLAYHLAVPKLWLQAGHIFYIPFIHHSNFPFTVEDLYIWGLMWGGQSGAKAFSLAFFVFGILAVFGLARRRYSVQAGWWSAIAFATVPVVLWESGTGYIDVAHGLFGGLGVLFAAQYLENSERKSDLWLAAVLLGFAAGSKYTGLQTIAVTALVLALGFARSQRVGDGVKSAALLGLVAMAVACPWYVKNVLWTGNPVYPFFYERLGGHDWDQRRADIYRNEQQKFGAGAQAERHSPTEVGNAILGLTYQPGRYVNPAEDQGMGTPLGAIGVVVVAAGLFWALSGRLRRYEAFLLAFTGISLVLWFFLSQQSRYVVPLAAPLALLAGGAVASLKLGRILAGAIVFQAAYSLGLVYTQRFQSQLQPVLGKSSIEDYQTHAISFYRASQLINKEVAGGKVALYDEVFGYLLDVPYIWANPGHSTRIPYDSMADSSAYVAALKNLGITHVYINLSPLVKDPTTAQKWIASMGLSNDPSRPTFTPAERSAMTADWQQKWMILLADAVHDGKLSPVSNELRGGILFKVY